MEQVPIKQNSYEDVFGNVVGTEMEFCSDDEQRGEIVWKNIKNQFGISSENDQRKGRGDMTSVEKGSDELLLFHNEMLFEDEINLIDGFIEEDVQEIVDGVPIALQESVTEISNAMAVDDEEDSDMEKNEGNKVKGKISFQQWEDAQRK